MARFIVNVLAFVIAFVAAGALFGLDPSWQEIALVLGAAMFADFVEGLIFGERR